MAGMVSSVASVEYAPEVSIGYHLRIALMLDTLFVARVYMCSTIDLSPTSVLYRFEDLHAIHSAAQELVDAKASA